MHIIDNLKVKIFLKTNILNSKRMSIDVNEEKLLIKSYNDLIMNI